MKRNLDAQTKNSHETAQCKALGTVSLHQAKLQGEQIPINTELMLVCTMVTRQVCLILWIRGLWNSQNQEHLPLRASWEGIVVPCT